MKLPQLPPVSRRDFLKTAAALPSVSAAAGVAARANAEADGYVSDFVRITPDNRVVVVVKHVEAGQGSATGLATLVAEEMNADWAQVETEFAPADDSRYANLFYRIQGTGGSTSIANSFAQYRRAGAEALARLRAAAAKQWNASPENIRAENGALIYGDRRALYGEMAAAANREPAPAAAPELKKPEDFVHIGKENRPRKDLAGKLNGEAKYAMDIRLDNMLYAVVLRAPKFGGELKSFDDSAARAVSGFAGAKAVPSGVAVYGETAWAAISARRKMRAEWDFSRAETRSSAQILADAEAALAAPGLVAREEGDADGAMESAAHSVSADFAFPFLAHAPMEPPNCVIQKRGDKITLWDGCQMPGIVKPAVANIFALSPGIAKTVSESAILGFLARFALPPDNVEIISTFAGGTFGRRATPGADYQSEAAHALRVSPDISRPLKLLWTREDDIRGGYYRPLFAHRVRAGLAADGSLLWSHRIAGKSILIGTAFELVGVKDGVDSSSVEGSATLPYAAPHIRVDVRNTETAVPVLWWRAVGHTHGAFAAETAMNMLAEAAGEDAADFRLRLLQNKPRHAGVLRAATEAAGWRAPPAAGRFRGVAVHESFGSFVAQVAEVSRREDGAIKVEKITCAADCGAAINPDMIRAQMESGIGYGLGAAMRNQITLDEGGEVRESNFPDYAPLRIGDMPEVQTVIVPSAEPPTGAGEPGLPPVAPALAAAIRAATGKWVTHLPFAAHGVKFV